MKNSKKLLAGGLVVVLVVAAIAVLGTGSGDELIGKLKLRKNTTTKSQHGSITENTIALNAQPNADFDGDGISNAQEACMGLNPFFSDAHLLLSGAQGSADFDRDGFDNHNENVFHTDACDSDTDNDGYSDGYEMEDVSGPYWIPRSDPLDPCDPNPNATACLVHIQER